MLNKFIRILVLDIVIAALLAPAPLARTSEEKDQSIRLVLFMVIDQARYEYLDRFQPVLDGGLGYLIKHGVLFTNAQHDHAVTATGVGHAVLSTGAYPSRSGIVGNEWYDRAHERSVNCVEDSSAATVGPESEVAAGRSGRSPKNLLAPTLADWIAKADPESKIFSASKKDRGAILLGAHGAGASFWYDSSTGNFVTSSAYTRTYPAWAREFRKRDIPESYFGTAWSPLPVKVPLESLQIEDIPAGLFRVGFPHPLDGLTVSPGSSFYSAFGNTPFVDLYLAEFAKTLIDQEDLGQDDHVDYLGLSFSAVDSVGHSYGPNSPEILDSFLRLDQGLAGLLDEIRSKVGLEHVLIIVTGDHGVMPLPEYLQTHHQPGSRIDVPDLLCFQKVGRRLNTKFGDDQWVLDDGYINYEALGRHNVRRQDVEREMAQAMELCPSVEHVYTRTELESPPEHPSRHMQQFINNFEPKRSGDIFVQFKEFCLPSMGRGASHGSVYEYDTHVPVLLLLPGHKAARISDLIHTVDVAPTIASILGIQPTAAIDGTDRTALLK